MIEELEDWFNKNLLTIKERRENGIYVIEGVGEVLFLYPKYFSLNPNRQVTKELYERLSDSERSIKIFDEEFSLILSDKEYELAANVEYLIFKFGSDFYYTDRIEKPKLTKLKYIGKPNILFTQDKFPFVGVHGGYELCDGSRRYEDWCKKAQFLDVDILGLCEENTLAGVLAFQKECKKYNITPIIGETVVVRNNKGDYRVKLYCKNREVGWSNLLTINKNLNVINNSFIEEDTLLTLSDGLICLLGNDISLSEVFDKYNKSKFELYYQFDLTEWLSQDREETVLINIQEYLSDYLTEILPVLVSDAYYLDKEDYYIRRILNRVGHTNFKNQSRNLYFKTLDDYASEIVELIPDTEKALELLELVIENTKQVFTKELSFSLIDGQIYFPKYVMTEEEQSRCETNEDLFYEYLHKGLQIKVIDKKLNPKPYLQRIEEEMEVLKMGGFIDYFLILADIYRYCDENGIWYGIGRGSATGCLCAYLADITGVDPLQFDLLFERFLNKGRVSKGGSAPDIDSDFSTVRRPEVKKYIEEKYGYEQVTSIGTFSTFKLRNALKDVGRMYGVNSTTVNFITPLLPDPEQQQPQPFNDLFIAASGDTLQHKMVRDFIQQYPKLVETLPLLLNQPKNTSIHAAGIIIAPFERGPAFKQFPVKLIDGILVSEWEGHYIDEAGLLKLDILGLQQLDKFAEIHRLIKEMTGKDVKFKDISLNDEKVFELFRHGYNEDVFQLGAIGLKNYCKQLQPTSIEDLIATVALYRPGPIESGTHLKYIKAKNGEEPVTPYTGTEEITKNTFGLIVYQEQVMQICQKLADFSLSEADDVRKALGKMKLDIIAAYREIFLERVEKKGYNSEEMKELWLEMERFAAYAFNKCISGDESIYRASHNKSGKSTFYPTIREMYLIKNNVKYARDTNHEALHDRYRNSYGHGFSLNENGKLIKNNIVDIRYVGEREIYRMTLKSGETFDGTLNHKFPTSNGEKMLGNIDVKVDKIFVNEGHRSKIPWTKLDSGKDNFPQEGQQGFRTKGDTPHKQFNLIEEQKTNHCENCNKTDCRIEIHHKNRDRTNNTRENIAFLCPSCHKKDEYRLGRVKIGESVLHTRLESIESIELLKVGDVYDVEMAAPYHTFTTKNNIVTSNSHAAAYAITGYYSQWYKVHFPLQFWTTSLKFSSSNSKGRDQRADRVIEILSTTDIKVDSVDINYSELDFSCNVEQNSIYWSLLSVSYVAEASALSIIEERKNGLFYSLEEFYERIKIRKGVNSKAMENLIISGAFDNIEGIQGYPEKRFILLQQLYVLLNREFKEEFVKMEYWLRYQWILAQKKLIGFGIVDFHSLVEDVDELSSKHYKYRTAQEILNEEYRENSEHIICGILVEVKERKSRNGIFGQLLIQDNTDMVYVTMWNETYEQYKEQFILDRVIVLNGVVVQDSYKKQNVIHTNVKTHVSIL